LPFGDDKKGGRGSPSRIKGESATPSPVINRREGEKEKDLLDSSRHPGIVRDEIDQRKKK